MAEIAVVCENKIVGWLPRPETRADVAVFVLCEPTRSAEVTAEGLYYPLAAMNAAISATRVALPIVPFWSGDQGEILRLADYAADESFLCWRVDFMIHAGPNQLDDIAKIRGWRRAAPKRIIDLGSPI